MIISLWRYAHLTLALFSASFLIIASITGTILAIDTINDKASPYHIEQLDQVTLATSLPVLKKNYSEIIEVSIDKNNRVAIEAIDTNGDEIKCYIDPLTGKSIGKIQKKSDFIQWVTSLHRSLFLHETGRFIIGINAFLLLLIALSGSILLIKRQSGIRHFFSQTKNDFFAQSYHVVMGRLLLVPIITIALTGTYLFLDRFTDFENSKQTNKTNTKSKTEKLDLKKTHLTEVIKIEFPFSDDPEDFYSLELKDRKIEVNQSTYEITNEEKLSTSKQLVALSFDLHTGQSNLFWAIVLGFASLNILFFIISGFTITFKRRKNRIKNLFSAKESTYILLIGSENGNTFSFAKSVYNQLIQQGQSVHIAQLNHYNVYPKCEHLIIFTSTYGLGEAPSNANQFSSLLRKHSQSQKINFSVIGFGSSSYPDFCGFAKKVDQLLENQPWAKRLITLHTVNNKSVSEFVNWITSWNSKSSLQLATTPALYSNAPKDLEDMIVLQKTALHHSEETFLITFKTKQKNFTSGDLLAIYPSNNNLERLYSIGKTENKIQLSVKLHPSGLGSTFLYNLKQGDIIKARILNNSSFHFPREAKEVILISNGTGIAPFIGMIQENTKKKKIHLYSGFRTKTETTAYYEKFTEEMIEKKQLLAFKVAYSRTENHQYVTDLIKNDIYFFTNILATGGYIMICGSLAMQKDVETLLNDSCLKTNHQTLLQYKTNGQIKTDCY